MAIPIVLVSVHVIIVVSIRLQVETPMIESRDNSNTLWGEQVKIPWQYTAGIEEREDAFHLMGTMILLFNTIHQ